MVIVGKVKGTINDAKFREFQNKDKTKTFSFHEISFYSEELHINGILKDWDKTIPIDQLTQGRKITIAFQACGPKKDCFGVFDFNGYPIL